MKISKLTSALIGLGFLSAAGVVQASNPVVYLAGASVLRSTLYTVLTTAGNNLFDGGVAGAVVSAAPNNTSTSTYIVFEGPVNGTITDISIFWTGAEAGVSDAAGNPLTQTLTGVSGLSGGGPGTYPLPGSPGVFLQPPSSGLWHTTGPVPSGHNVGNTADLALDDTSQAVSQTPHSLFPLVDYGAVAVVPFAWLKGYQSAPDAAYNRVVNVTTAQVNHLLGGTVPVNYITGNLADANDTAFITGRNYSSGTRVNAVLTAQYGTATPVDQFAFQVNYNTPGVLAVNSTVNYSSPGSPIEIGNDGFNSSPTAAAQLNFDGSGQQIVLIEPLGIPDAQAAHDTPPSGGGAPVFLSYNGVYESDAAVENGSYTFWGYEHIFGAVGQSSSSQAGLVGAGIALSVVNYVAAHYGTATGDTSPGNYHDQSPLIPISLLQVTRSGDGGFPSPKL